MKLFGRNRELAAFRATLEVSIDGIKSVLVVRGEAGAGKSAVLAAFAERAPSNVLVLRIEGVESESDIGYGGLQRLLNALLPKSDSLPAPQRQALHTAFGLIDGPMPDRFHVGLATLTLLADAAAESPVLCVIDARALARPRDSRCVGIRRQTFLADRVAMVFAVRDINGIDALRGSRRVDGGRAGGR